MFELYQLRYFLAVVETGNFTKAAERAYVTQPTLSAGIAKLEAALGARLFDRTNRRVALTKAGSRFLERAKSILHECTLAQSEVSGIAAPRVLRLGALLTVPATVIGGVIGDFLARNQGCTVDLFDGTEQELANRLDQGQVDVALTVLRGEGTPLFTEGYSLAIAADHRLAGREEIDIGEIADEPVIIRTRCEILSETSRFFTDHNLRPPIAYRTEQDERALAMVAAGLAVTTMPESYQAQGVARVRLKDFEFKRTIGTVGDTVGGTGSRGRLSLTS
ncbi:MAG: LysR family transcriptional regulator [Sphingomonadales bacterium]